jgi:hypothetical protein
VGIETHRPLHNRVFYSVTGNEQSTVMKTQKLECLHVGMLEVFQSLYKFPKSRTSVDTPFIALFQTDPGYMF